MLRSAAEASPTGGQYQQDILQGFRHLDLYPPYTARRTTGVRRQIEHVARDTGAGHLSVDLPGLAPV